MNSDKIQKVEKILEADREHKNLFIFKDKRIVLVREILDEAREIVRMMT
jgi:hypothetical protein